MWDGDHTTLEQNMARFALLSLVSLPHQPTLSTASPCARHPARDQRIASSQHHLPAGKQAFTLSQTPGLSSSTVRETSQRAPTTTPNQSSSEPGQLLTGSGLGHGPAARHQRDPPVTQPPPFVSSCRFTPRLPELCPGTPPSSSIHPQASSQQPQHLWPDTRVPTAALEVTYKTDGGRGGPASTSCSSAPAFSKGAFGIATVAEEGTDTNRRLCCYQTTVCVEQIRFLPLNRWHHLIREGQLERKKKWK